MDTVLERIQWNILLAGCLLASQIFPIYLQQVHGTVFSNECACPGDILIYECTVVGVPEGATVWRGTAFDCRSNGITLLHSRFASGTFGVCNDGAIVARSLSVEGSNYTSLLNVNVTSDAARKTIECVVDDASNDTIQFSAVIPTVITGPFPPPDRLYVSSADFSSRKLTFDWSSVATECHKIQYNILASNCGSCPTTTNHTTVTCTNIPTNGSMCVFAVQTVICEDFWGNISTPVKVTTVVDNDSSTVVGNENIASLSTVVVGGILLLLTLIVLLTFILYKLIKRSNSHSLPNRRVVQEDNYPMRYQQSKQLSLENDDIYSHIGESEPLNLNSLLSKLQNQVPNSRLYKFGMALGIPKQILDKPEHQSEESRLPELLDYWLKNHQGRPTWQEVAAAQSMICQEADGTDNVEYSCLNEHYGSKGDVDESYLTANSQRQTSSVNNKPLGLYTEDTHVYDTTSHDHTEN